MASAPAIALPTLRRRTSPQPLRAEASACMDAFVVRDCLSATECAAVVAAAAPCLTTATSRGPRHGEAHRRHGRAECSSHEFAAQLWERLAPALAEALPAACALSPALRFYAYSPIPLPWATCSGRTTTKAASCATPPAARWPRATPCSSTSARRA